MRCLYYSYCNEPEYLCCNFCSDKDCKRRCRDDHTSCKLYEEGPVEVDREKVNHIKDKVKNKDKIVYKEKDDKKQTTAEVDVVEVTKKKRGRPKKEPAVNNNTPFIKNQEVKDVERGD